MAPFFITQVFETAENPFGDDGRKLWLEEQVEKARSEGATWGRASITDAGDGLLFEAWKKRPEDEGEPRWSLTEEEKSK